MAATGAVWSPLPNAGLTRALILFTRLDERYQRLLQERNWQSPPPLAQLIDGFNGKLTEGLSPEQLDNLEPLLQQMTSRYTTRIYNQRRGGYPARVLDVAYVILCENALDKIRRQRERKKEPVPTPLVRRVRAPCL
jgi:hypothetical protein